MKKIGLFLLGFLLVAIPAMATVTANTGIAVQTPKEWVVQFLQGTDVALTYKTLATGGSSGTKISGIYVTNEDGTAAHLVTCQVKVGAVYFGGTAVNVPLNSGYANGVPAINLMSSVNWPGLPVDAWGNPYLLLNNGDLLVCTFATTLTASTYLNVVAEGGGDF